MADKYYYGLDAEIQKKLAAKFDPVKAAQAQAWLEAITGLNIEGSLQEGLKSGVVLCTALNRIKPHTVQKINTLSSPFKERENIENYIKGCKELGMKEVDLFVTVDLYEGQNMTLVVDNIQSLGGIAQKHNPNLPAFGIKYSEENARNFSDEQLRAGKEMGTKLGMGSYGVQDETKNPILARQIIKNVSGHVASSEPTAISKGSIDTTKDKGSKLDKIIHNPDLLHRGAAPASHDDVDAGAGGFCTECGAQKHGTAKFCGGCGHKF